MKKIIKQIVMKNAVERLKAKGSEIIEICDLSMLGKIITSKGEGITVVADKNGNLIGILHFRKEKTLDDLEVVLKLMSLDEGIIPIFL